MASKIPDPVKSAAGKLGGPARAKALTAKRRKTIAKKAAEARWADVTK